MPKSGPASTAERKQYAVLSKFLREQLHCENTWHVGLTPRIALDVPDPHQRIPDVVGARKSHHGWETIIVEAKKLSAGGHAIQSAIAQLQAVSQWADYRYLSLEALDWQSRDTGMQGNIENTARHAGLGLLTVSGTEVTVIFEAQRNPNVEPSQRKQLLEELEIDFSTWRIPDVLSLSNARVAIQQLALVHDCIEGPLSNAIVTRFGGSELTASLDSYHEERPWAILTTNRSLSHGARLEGDPYGYYADDGVPTLWLWVPVASLDAAERIAPKGASWFISSENRREDERIQRVEDADWQQTARDGFTRDVHIGYRLLVFGRTSSGISQELNAVLDVTEKTLGRKKPAKN